MMKEMLPHSVEEGRIYAIALAGALRARNCQIFTDVEGVLLLIKLLRMPVKLLLLITKKWSN